MKRIIIAGTVVALVAALALAGWLWARAEWGFSRTASSANLAHVELTESAASASAIASAGVPTAPSKADYTQWKAEMTAACAAGDAALHIEHFDINGDKTPDAICWRVLKTPAHGDFIDLQARVKHGGQVQTAYILLPFDASREDGVCGPPEAIKVEEWDWTRKDFKDLGWDYIGPVSITVNGGDCDPPWLFWPKNATGDEVDFDFERM